MPPHETPPPTRRHQLTWQAVVRPVSAAVVLDSFTDGAFTLQFSGPTGQTLPLSNSPLNSRYAGGYGDRDWNAAVDVNAGQLTYNVNLRGQPSGQNGFHIYYSNTDGYFSLLGVTAFGINVTSLTGHGFYTVSVDGLPDFNDPKIPFSEPGELVFPVASLVTGMNLNELYRLHFEFIPATADFSMTVDQITLIPEAGTTGLAMLGVALAMVRRR
jgi:hypothetical protein